MLEGTGLLEWQMCFVLAALSQILARRSDGTWRYLISAASSLFWIGLAGWMAFSR